MLTATAWLEKRNMGSDIIGYWLKSVRLWSYTHPEPNLFFSSYKKNIFLEKNIFFSMDVDKMKRKIIFEIAHWPFELPSNYQRPSNISGCN